MPDIKLIDFNVNLQFKPEHIGAVKNDAGADVLVISSCAIHLFDDDRIWSSFEDLTFNRLNGNDWGLGVVDFEIGFTGYTGSAYPKVYTKCFELRTDTGLRIKPMKRRNDTNESKVNQRGETVIGIRYYFQKREEIQQLVDSKRVMFESFFALDKPTNVYGFMCQLKRNNAEWSAEYTNTFRPDYAKNIKSLID